MSYKIKIEKNSVSETLVLPLNARVHCSKRYPDVFADPEAERIDYDFTSLQYKEFVMLTWAARNRILCDHARAYLMSHPRATVVNLGCGADTSFAAIDNGQCHFLNLDLPQVIEARRQLIPLREREKNVAADLFDLGWLNEVETPPEDGIFIISGGVLMFFEAERLRPLLDGLAQRLPGGGICFDGESASAVKKSNKIVAKSGNQGAMVKFAVDDVDTTFRGWSAHFGPIRVTDRLPRDIARARSIPFMPKTILKMGFRMGMIKFVEISFKK